MNNDFVQKIPLLSQQKGILFDIFFAKTSASLYLIQVIFHFKKPIKYAYMEQAWNVIIQRHDALRATFQTTHSDLAFYIHPNAYRINPQVIDLRNIEQTDRNRTITHLLNADINTPIDITEYPLMRWLWVKISERETYLVWTIHHALIGLANSGVFIVNELFKVYNHLSNHCTRFELPYPRRYNEVIQQILQVNTEDSRQYWQSLLKNCKKPTSLPFQKIMPNDASSQQYSYFEISDDAYQQASKLKSKLNITFSTLFQGAWGILLSKYTNEKNILFGSVRGFPKKDIGYCVGCFINVLPIMIRIDHKTHISSYLQGIRKQQEKIREYVYTPIHKIRQWCQLINFKEIFFTIVDFKPTSLNSVIRTYPEFKLSTEINFLLNTNYALVLEIVDEKGCFSGRLHYKNQIFSKEEIEQLLIHFKLIFRYLLDAPGAFLSDMEILTLQEKQKLLFEWNHKQDCHLMPPNIISLFEYQAAHFQKHIALVFNSITITYADLNNRANQVTTYLLQELSENKTEQFIGVIMDRGIEVIISILGILKAGFAFIPIHPKWPIQRIKFICKDASIPIILTQDSLVERYKIIFPDITINSLKHFVKNERTDLDAKICVSRQKAAYVIYTSGTTQSPRGVVVEHGALLNTICNHIQYLHVDNDSIVLNFSSPTFDVYVAELAMTLCTGAKLCITPKKGILGQTLFDFMEQHQITTAMLPASVLERLPQKPLQTLMVLVSGGEVCQQETIDYWAKNRIFLNAYGLTETAICSSMHSNSNSKAEQYNIGTPLPNVQIYILDETQKLLPVGVSGKIYIAGMSLARGYLNEPDLTKQVFINNPFGPNKKMCRTDDYGRWRLDGNLEYLGRQDSQIKLRGYRINLQEINTTLLSNPVIKNSVTIVQTQIEKILIAYVVLKKYTKSFNSLSLKKFLKKRLPEYMVPNLFIVVQNIPLTDNGKIDYLKLNQLFNRYQKKMRDEQIDNTVDKQTSSIKRSIIDTLKGLLCCNVIPENINFFDLGMHSFLLIRAIETLNKKFSIQINVMDFFNYPTVNKLIAYLEEKLKWKK